MWLITSLRWKANGNRSLTFRSPNGNVEVYFRPRPFNAPHPQSRLWVWQLLAKHKIGIKDGLSDIEVLPYELDELREIVLQKSPFLQMRYTLSSLCTSPR